MLASPLVPTQSVLRHQGVATISETEPLSFLVVISLQATKRLRKCMRVLRGWGISPRSWFRTSPFDFLKESGVGERSVIQREVVGRTATSKEDEEVAIEVTVKVVYCGGTKAGHGETGAEVESAVALLFTDETEAGWTCRILR
jgi:hypothetical protein